MRARRAAERGAQCERPQPDRRRRFAVAIFLALDVQKQFSKFNAGPINAAIFEKMLVTSQIITFTWTRTGALYVLPGRLASLPLGYTIIIVAIVWTTDKYDQTF